MIPQRIDISVPDQILALNAEKQNRLDRVYRFEAADRTPVVVDAQVWYLLFAHGASFADLMESPRIHLLHLILNQKFRYEHVCDDKPIDTKKMVIEPDFGALRGTEFPIGVCWQDDQPAKSVHILHQPEQIDQLAVPDPWDGLNAKRLEFYHGMRAVVGDFDVRLNGTPLEIQITIDNPGGPFPSAFALAGPNLLEWMMSEPDRVQRLMEITTASFLQTSAYLDQLTGRPGRRPIWLGADAAEMISPRTYRQFVAPSYRQVYEHFGSTRIYHQCGKIDHLLDTIRDDVLINELQGFGFPTSRRLLGEKLGGRVVIRGGPHPLLINDGPSEKIIAECMDYIHTTGVRGGYILADGFGLMPGTPPEHIDAMVEASRRAAAA